MATAATRLKLEKLRDVQRCHISRFTIPSVAPSSTSTVYSLDVGVREGMIQVVRIASLTGVDYTVSFRDIEGSVPAALAFTVDEVLRVENIDATGFQATSLGVIYSNDDEFENPAPGPFGGELPILYVLIDNNDGGAATGTITIELIIESGD